MMIHPAPYESTEFPALAWQKFNVLYQGHAAHASMFPEQGINAADALTIAQVAIGLLRQHIGTGCQVHGIVTDGGDAANIIPGHAAGEFMARAMTLGELERELVPRLTRCFEAGALATGATVAMERSGPSYSEFRADPGLLGMYARNALAIGRRFQEGRVRSGGSTDMANVSLALPAIHPMMNINSGGAGNHQPEFAAAAVTPDADKVVRDGAIAMAWTIIDTATDVAQRSRLLKLQDGAAN
jgi:metal-dependent amidase/aminoacylase/carboxypeptidase family protein